MPSSPTSGSTSSERSRCSLSIHCSFTSQPAAHAAWRTASATERYASGSSMYLPTSRSEEHTSELQSQSNIVCRLLLEKKKTSAYDTTHSCYSHLSTGKSLFTSFPVAISDLMLCVLAIALLSLLDARGVSSA